MQYSLAILGLVALAQATPQGVTAIISPTAAAPPGCTDSVASPFQITVINATTSSHTKRQTTSETSAGALILSLKNGILMNQQGDTAYEAANQQFQFDKPPQTGAIYTAGFTFCPNMTLALGGSTLFYQCNSGNFGNLYTSQIDKYCTPVYLSGSTSGPASMVSSGSSSAGAASAIPDGQPQAATSAAVSQISDHQPQAPTAAPVTQISDHQPQAPTAAPVSQISDHQPQAPTAAPVSQISDHQPQAPTMAVNATATYSPVAYTGGAAVHGAEYLALAAGAVAVALL